jgi:hypothetical protein
MVVARWPVWAPFTGALWGVVYAVVQVVWVVSGTDVAWTVFSGRQVQVGLAACGVIGAGLCLAARQGSRAVVGVGLVLVAGVFGLGMLGLPMYFVTIVSGAGIESVAGLVQVVVNAAGAGLMMLVGLSYVRRLRGLCPRCGQAHAATTDARLAYPGASVASRRIRVAVYLLMCGILPWAGVKTVWLLGGDALGVTARAWRREVEAGAKGAAKALATVGVDVTVLAALLGVFLMLGLLHRWGLIFPRWTLLLSGRRVPRLLPLIPAWLTAASLSVYGIALLVIAPLSVVGVLPGFEPVSPFTTRDGLTWMIEFGGLAFTGLGVGLIVAAWSYGRRTRPVCATAGE